MEGQCQYRLQGKSVDIHTLPNHLCFTLIPFELRHVFWIPLIIPSPDF